MTAAASVRSEPAIASGSVPGAGKGYAHPAINNTGAAMSNELVWHYCEKCGTKFSKHQKGFERYCPACHIEANNNRAGHRIKNEDSIYAFRLIYDPSGDYPKGAIFGMIDMACTLYLGGFDDGTKFIFNKDRHRYEVKGNRLINDEKIMIAQDYWMKIIDRKAEKNGREIHEMREVR